MDEKAFAFLITGVLLVIFYLLGLLFQKEKEHNGICYTLVYGFFAYFMVFEVVALFFKITLQPLSNLSLCWGVIIVCLLVISIKRALVYELDRIKKILVSPMSITAIFIGGIIVFQIVLVVNNIHDGSPIDSAYYIGSTGSSVWTNTIDQFDPYTGIRRLCLEEQYLLLTYPIHNAVLSQFTGVHHLIIYHQVMATIVVLMNSLILYCIAREIFNEHKECLIISWFFMVLAQYFCYSMYSPAGFLFYRAFEGKTIIANVVILAVLLFYIRSWKADFCPRSDTRGLFITQISSISFSMSGIILLPVMFLIYYVPAIIIKRNKQVVKQFVMCTITSSVILIIYLLVLKGVWIVEIH